MARRDFIVGRDNLFKDLGHPRPAEALAKAELARKIAELIAKRRLTQAAAAEPLNVDQPKVSALVRGRLAGFSLWHLARNEFGPAATAILLFAVSAVVAYGRRERAVPSQASTATRLSRLGNTRVLFGAEGLGGLDTQASTGRANRGEQSDDRHDHGRDRQQRAAEGAEQLAVAGPIAQ